MNVNVVCIGSLKESYLKEAEKEYLKRLKKYGKFNVFEIKESKLPKLASNKDIDNVLEDEASKILPYLDNAFVIALAIEGKMFSSESITEKLSSLQIYGDSKVVVVIGGSHGLSTSVKQKANLLWSFSELTFPHQLMRVVLLEQLYRSMKILNNEPYHK